MNTARPQPREVDLAGVETAAKELARALPGGSVVWLIGPLGAGKTTFVRALVEGRGERGSVTSPTYGLVHHYRGDRGDIYHLDCYRLRDPEEAADFDWATFAAADLLLIEWPERAGAWAPPATQVVRLEHAADDTRMLDIA